MTEMSEGSDAQDHAGVLDLPSALLSKVLARVEQRDRRAAALACRRLRDAAEDPASNPDIAVAVNLGGEAAERANAGALSIGSLRTLLSSQRFGAIEVLRIRVTRPAPAALAASDGLGAALSAVASSLRRLELTLPGADIGAALEGVQLQLAKSAPTLRELAVRFPSNPDAEVPAPAFVSALGGTHSSLQLAEFGLRVDGADARLGVSITDNLPALGFASSLHVSGSGPSVPSLLALCVVGATTGRLFLRDVDLRSERAALAAALVARAAITVSFISCSMPDAWPSPAAFARTDIVMFRSCRFTPASLAALAETGIAGAARGLVLLGDDPSLAECSGGDLLALLRRMRRLACLKLRLPWTWPGFTELLRGLPSLGVDLSAVSVEGTLRGEVEPVPYEMTFLYDAALYRAYQAFDEAKRRAAAKEAAPSGERALPVPVPEPVRNAARAVRSTWHVLRYISKDEPRVLFVLGLALLCPFSFAAARALSEAIAFPIVSALAMEDSDLNQAARWAVRAGCDRLGARARPRLAFAAAFCAAAAAVAAALSRVSDGCGSHLWAATAANLAAAFAFGVGRELGVLPPLSPRHRKACVVLLSGAVVAAILPTPWCSPP